MGDQCDSRGKIHAGSDDGQHEVPYLYFPVTKH